MSPPMAVMQGIMLGAQTYSGIAGALSAARSAGKLSRVQRELANREADQIEYRAQQQRAATQRDVIEARRQAELAASRFRAVQGASGTEAPAGLYGDLLYEGDILVLKAMYEGEELALGMEDQAYMTRAGGAASAYASQIEARNLRSEAFKTLMGGAGKGLTLYEKYKGTDVEEAA